MTAVVGETDLELAWKQVKANVGAPEPEGTCWPVSVRRQAIASGVGLTNAWLQAQALLGLKTHCSQLAPQL